MIFVLLGLFILSLFSLCSISSLVSSISFDCFDNLIFSFIFTLRELNTQPTLKAEAIVEAADENTDDEVYLKYHNIYEQREKDHIIKLFKKKSYVRKLKHPRSKSLFTEKDEKEEHEKEVENEKSERIECSKSQESRDKKQIEGIDGEVITMEKGKKEENEERNEKLNRNTSDFDITAETQFEKPHSSDDLIKSSLFSCNTNKHNIYSLFRKQLISNDEEESPDRDKVYTQILSPQPSEEKEENDYDNNDANNLSYFFD